MVERPAEDSPSLKSKDRAGVGYGAKRRTIPHLPKDKSGGTRAACGSCQKTARPHLRACLLKDKSVKARQTTARLLILTSPPQTPTPAPQDNQPPLPPNLWGDSEIGTSMLQRGNADALRFLGIQRV